MVTVLVDVDDTISNFLEKWVEWLNKEFDLNVKAHCICDWNIKFYFPTLSEEQLYSPLNKEEFWETVEPMKNSGYFLRKLIEDDFDVYLCTSAYYDTILPKYKVFIKKYFDFIPWKKVIVTSNKQMIKADILIDDAWHNVVGGSYLGVLVDKPHNRNNSSADVIRVKNWAEIYDVCKKYKLYSLIKEKQHD